MLRMTDPVFDPATVSGVTVSGVTVSGVTLSSSIVNEDFKNPSSEWLEVEHHPDTLHHVGVVNIRPMTAARTLAQEVLTIKLTQLPSVICMKIGEFAGRGILQFARVAKPKTFTYLRGPNSTLFSSSSFGPNIDHL